jgi:GPH family glycoside/pentoside/hexuronide:cation symporter
MFGSIYWWVVKLGMAAALLAGGFLLNATGFDVTLEGNQTSHTLLMLRIYDILIPVICSLLAILLVWKYPITEEKAHEVRQELEALRGARSAEA